MIVFKDTVTHTYKDTGGRHTQTLMNNGLWQVFAHKLFIITNDLNVQ